jgi:predicted dehydrogenase
VLVVGAGQMAEEHLRALLAAGVAADAVLLIGRGRDRAERLAARYGIAARWGGFESLAQSPPNVVIAVPETELAAATRLLIERGARRVLVEKPGALSPTELDGIDADRVFVAYNRRFYPSVSRARRLIAADGGVLSTAFDFTEIEQRVLEDAARRGLSPAVLARWGCANSLHLIDLAFHLAGEPARIHPIRSGTLPWHPSGAVFVGAGELHTGGLFSYGATWNGAGRWSVEVTTGERKLVLRPLETLHEQRRGSFALEPVELEPEPDGIKAGLSGQSQAFLAVTRGGQVDPALCTLAEARARLELANRIFGYG